MKQLLLILAISASAAPDFAAIFGNHAILQRGQALTIWGPGNADTLRLGNSEVPVANKQNSWRAVLPPQDANSEGQDLQLLAGDKLIASRRDICVGDVWLAAGQSNMQFTVQSMRKKIAWEADIERPLIRFRRVNDTVPAKTTDLSPTEWTTMSADSVGQFSAVAAVFATTVEKELQVPIGIIDVSWGGKPIESFIPREAFTTPLLSTIRDLADANKLDELAKLRGGLIIRNPAGHPGAIYQARMAPLVRFGLRGFLWYQAESNAGRGEDPREYQHKMAAMISGWRQHWPNAPCHFVQLPGYPPGTGWIRVREEQRRALAVANTGMVVTIDIPGDDIHPPNKIAVGERLAGAVLRGQSGPIYSGHKRIGAELHVSFSHADSGLMVGELRNLRTPQETPELPLRWFELAGEDGLWHPATARIDSKTVILSSESVPAPIELRYACHTQPQGGNLYNRQGFPASPFCSRLDWLPWHPAK
jgi:sialate O-acetylesterase